ncbi:MAG TPA: hypothetical protein VEY67_05935 [Candidatus Dormibacteraeota bacterium]|nr:hypothetical protein [Candidatus Dormibacteraeota bacterium]
MDDLKQGYRDVETETKKTWRNADGESVSDRIGNAGDEIRRDLGNAGDEADKRSRDMQRDDEMHGDVDTDTGPTV